MEVRAENNLLEQRIIDIIREEQGYSVDEPLPSDEAEEVQEVAEAESEPIKTPKPIIEDVEVEEVDDEISDVSILEVSEEPKTDVNGGK